MVAATNECISIQEHEKCDRLMALFADLFLKSHNTLLVRGGEEPLYLPAGEGRPHHLIQFARGFFASALHETSHWLIAGPKRRRMTDFGYWYQPDGRTEAQQRAFERVEVKPQAMEWILATASNHRFHFSADNLSGDTGNTTLFKEQVLAQVGRYVTQGLPKRAQRLAQALEKTFTPARSYDDLSCYDLNR